MRCLSVRITLATAPAICTRQPSAVFGQLSKLLVSGAMWRCKFRNVVKNYQNRETRMIPDPLQNVYCRRPFEANTKPSQTRLLPAFKGTRAKSNFMLKPVMYSLLNRWINLIVELLPWNRVQSHSSVRRQLPRRWADSYWVLSQRPVFGKIQLRRKCLLAGLPDCAATCISVAWETHSGASRRQRDLWRHADEYWSIEFLDWFPKPRAFGSKPAVTLLLSPLVSL